MTAKVIDPIAITPAMVTGNAPEAAPALYVGGTTYASGAQVGVIGLAGIVSVYQSKQAGNIGKPPGSSPLWWEYQCDVYQTYSGAATYAAEDRVQDNANHLVYESLVSGNVGNALTDETKWIEVGVTQKYAMFDDLIGTSTSSGRDLRVTVTPPPGGLSGVALLELSGAQCYVSLTSSIDSSLLYEKIINLDGSFIDSFHDWFFNDFYQRTDVVLTDLPKDVIASRKINIAITGSNASCGVCKIGRVVEIGDTKYGASVGILDWSVKERDKWGRLKIKQGEYSKRATFQTQIRKLDFNRIARQLTDLRGRLAVYIAAEYPGYDPLIVYGFYKDFSIVVEHSEMHLCSLEIEGTT